MYPNTDRMSRANNVPNAGSQGLPAPTATPIAAVNQMLAAAVTL
jgi:hypothetical protein